MSPIHITNSFHRLVIQAWHTSSWADLPLCLVSLLVKEKLYVNEVVLGTAFGILIGPHCANAFDPRSWGSHTSTITLEIMRIVLATGLFAIGVELPESYMADHAKGLLAMVVPTMAFGWVIVAGVIYGLFPGYTYISALVVAACLTPTDPIICATIVGGKWAVNHVPLNLRRILSAESAANDGLAYPFLSISIYLSIDHSRREAVGDWFLIGWLYQVILGTFLGAVLGQLFCKLMRLSHRRGFINRESYVAQYLALALFTIGICSTIGSDDLLAAFAAGTAISWDGYFNDQTENEVFSSVIDTLLNCACFVYIGAWLPFDQFNSPELGITPWRLIVLVIAILCLRRIPPLLLLYKWVPEISNWREALFSGHFGTCSLMGVGAVFISTLALTRLPTPQNPPQDQAEHLAATLQTIVSFVVLGSITIHGLSIPFFSLGKNTYVHTISMSRTLTLRNTGPEWLTSVRRASAPGSVRPQVDVEQQLAGTENIKMDVYVVDNNEGEVISRDVNVHSFITETTSPSAANDSTTTQSVRDAATPVNNSEVCSCAISYLGEAKAPAS
ncbi:hypothetical protein WOLCODRAFT_90572 [Wolfiporia cocos MD-104 SS10]|uniref:Cation/H+ exchanger transmembrane domain-containing protein n=1 Tax=Wolfiporia cocos (strain MD-104) TaxID=742152 RepID=A0A2H3JNW8_WOLCO|nr:hypothetical protein WOLCODRAFT_90572 [Wolfiporia cocos MD-104 SS10]